MMLIRVRKGLFYIAENNSRNTHAKYTAEKHTEEGYRRRDIEKETQGNSIQK